MTADTTQYNVNSFGHWQGLERTLKENLRSVAEAVENFDLSEITTELVKIENGQSSASQQLTEIETLITTTNGKLDTLHTDNTEAKTVLDSVKTNTANTKTSVDNVKTSVDTVNTSVTSTNSKLDTLSTKLDDILTKLDTVITHLATIATNTTPATTANS